MNGKREGLKGKRQVLATIRKLRLYLTKKLKKWHFLKKITISRAHNGRFLGTGKRGDGQTRVCVT